MSGFQHWTNGNDGWPGIAKISLVTSIARKWKCIFCNTLTFVIKRRITYFLHYAKFLVDMIHTNYVITTCSACSTATERKCWCTAVGVSDTCLPTVLNGYSFLMWLGTIIACVEATKNWDIPYKPQILNTN